MDDRELVKVGEEVDLPLTGALPFGVVDRGTNLLQIRPVSGCNLFCPFCSVDEGPEGNKQARYEVSPDYMVEYAGAMASRKESNDVEMHIDGCGEPLLYPKIVELVDRFSRLEDVEVMSMQTNGMLLDEEMINQLEEAGLDRINLTINSLEDERAKFMAGTGSYDLNKVRKNAEAIAESEIDLLIAPVWIDGLNDGDIEEIVQYAKGIGAGENWPALGIQKYREHRNGRKVDGCSEKSWKEFHNKLRSLEEKYSIKLRLSPKDFNIEKVGFALPKVFRRGEKVKAEVLAQGWNPGQKLAVSDHRTITVLNGEKTTIGEKIDVEILRSKHNLYLGKVV
ncbi:MAG: radical SAM protein [Candidatus Aenigmatarchaeota archaeon]